MQEGPGKGWEARLLEGLSSEAARPSGCLSMLKGWSGWSPRPPFTMCCSLRGRGRHPFGRSHGQQGTRGREGFSVADLQARMEYILVSWTALCVLPWFRPASQPSLFVKHWFPSGVEWRPSWLSCMTQHGDDLNCLLLIVNWAPP